MNKFHLHIVTPDKDFYSGDIEYLCVDTPDGKEGFLHGAMPRVVVLCEGSITIKTAVLELTAFCGSGLVCVGDDGVTVLTERCRFSDEENVVDTDTADDGAASLREYRAAKARIASTVSKLRDKKSDVP